MRVWQALDSHLHHLFLMMSFDFPLEIRHKKGEYIWMEIGGKYEFLELWSFRLYLGASSCIFLFIYLAHDVFILMYLFLCDVYVRGRHYFLFLFLVSHCATLAIDL